MRAETLELLDMSTTGPAITPRELWNLYHKSDHDSETEEKLVQLYLPLVKTTVGRIAMTLPAHVEYDDLYSAGLVGLLQAIRNYDPASGNTFETYAKMRIRGAVLDELRKMDWVPRSIHAKAKKVQEAIIEVENRKGRIASEEDIAKELNISLAEYQELLDEIRPVTFICLDSVKEDEDNSDTAVHEYIADQTTEMPDIKAEKKELVRLIAERIEQLPVIHRKVLAMYYFENMRLKEIAEAFDLTESRISQIHAQAILSIRAYLQKNKII